MSLILAIIAHNRRGGGPPPSGGTWNPADKDSHVTLSDANKTMNTTDSSWYCVRGVTSRSAGKLYLEFKQKTSGGGGYSGMGLANASCSLTEYPGSTADAWAFLSDGYKAHNGYSDYGSSVATGGVLRFAIDFAARKIWIGLNGTWFASGNPATGASPTFTGVTGTLFPIGGDKYGSASDSITLKSAAADLTYAPPSGFTSWE